ncbi:hypothetical protein U9R62_10060 [Cylindrospermopsis raciborskii DSH]
MSRNNSQPPRWRKNGRGELAIEINCDRHFMISGVITKDGKNPARR